MLISTNNLLMHRVDHSEMDGREEENLLRENNMFFDKMLGTNEGLGPPLRQENGN